MIQHTVLIKFPKPLTDDDRLDMDALVRAMSTEIPDVHKLRFGTAASKEYSDGYEYLLFMELTDWDALNVFMGHPAHKKFGQWMTDRRGAFLVFDFALNEGSVFLG